MNPKPSLVQALVLHEIDDNGVWFDTVTGTWQSTYRKNKVCEQINILHRDGYIKIVDTVVSVTPMGAQVLRRRPYAEIVEKLNSR